MRSSNNWTTRACGNKRGLVWPRGLRTPTLPLEAAPSKQLRTISPDQKKIFIFGLGYTSIGLGNWLAADGWKVSGTCRTHSRVEGLCAKGWTVDVYDPARGSRLTRELRAHLEDSPYVLSSVPPLALALYDPALGDQKALLRPLAASGHIAWFGYLSSTGVYGDWQGEWVDESSPCRQTSPKGIVRQEAEAAWLQMYEQYGLPVHIFRLGGIYGPGRSVLDSLERAASELSRSQQRRSSQRYTARCHVYDICAVLASSMAKPRPGGVYNVVDDDPAPRTEVMSYAKSLLAQRLHNAGFVEPGAISAGSGSDSNHPVGTAGSDDRTRRNGGAGVSAPGSSGSSEGAQPRPPSLNVATGAADVASAAATAAAVKEKGSSEPSIAGSSSGGSSFGADRGRGAASGGRGEGEGLEEKRVRNGLIKSELNVRLRYGTYREGVAAIHHGEYWPLTAEDLRLV